METLSTIINLLRPNDYLTSLDLKDAFHHVPIHPSHRHLLRFHWKGQTYQYTSLPFGLSLSPWLFTKVTKPLLQWARRKGIRLTAYLDDFLIIAPSHDLSLKHTRMVQDKMTQLGWIINFKKSNLTPARMIEHLGMTLNTSDMTVSIPGKKIRAIRRQAYHLLYQTTVTAKQLAAFIGSALATQLGNQQARFRTRHLISQLNKTRSHNSTSWNHRCDITQPMRQDLLWWISQLQHWNGRRMLPHQPTVQIFTDASDSGWGIIINQQQYRGKWSPSEQATHINYKELLVIWKLFSVFPAHQHRHLQLCMDNTAAIAYINKFGGTRSSVLNNLAMQIWQHCFRHRIFLSTLYVPSICNPADAPSRQMIQQNDWAITPSTFHHLDHLWGPHSIDLFASPDNTKIPHNFVSWKYHPQAAWINAFSRNWTTIPGRLYLCPPWNLIPTTLLRLNQQPRPATLITPNWPSAPWWPTVTAMAQSPPITLPPTSIIHHQNDDAPTHQWSLTAWNL